MRHVSIAAFARPEPKLLKAKTRAFRLRVRVGPTACSRLMGGVQVKGEIESCLSVLSADLESPRFLAVLLVSQESDRLKRFDTRIGSRNVL